MVIFVAVANYDFVADFKAKNFDMVGVSAGDICNAACNIAAGHEKSGHGDFLPN